MPYNPSTDLVGLWRSVSGGVEKAEMPGLDFVVAAMTRAGLMRTVTSQTAPTTNQATTAWFQPANPSYASEGTLFLWDPSLNMYVPATPELFHGGSSGGGGDGGGGSDMVIISGTAPSNPVAGQEWWNGTILQLWDGVMWKAVGPPLTPAGTPLETSTGTFSITQSTQYTITASTWTIIPYTDVPQINDGGWDNTTKKYTPKKAGYYSYNLRVWPGTGQGGCAILKNDDGIYDNNSADIVIAMSLTSTPTINSATGIAQMNGTTDYVRCFAWNAGALLNAVGSSPAFSALRLS